MTMSEALEARGFGGVAVDNAAPLWTRWAMVGGIGGGMLAAYAFAVGREVLALGGLLGCGGLMLAAARGGPHAGRVITRYRESRWQEADWLVAGCALVALTLFLLRRWAAPEAAIFNPYPDLAWPETDLWMLLALVPLLLPAFIVPRSAARP